jgi:hypothetical protein
MLKKEFKEKDVERIRNLVKGKSGERTISGVGFVKKQNFTKREIYGNKMVANGPLKVALSKTLPN